MTKTILLLTALAFSLTSCDSYQDTSKKVRVSKGNESDSRRKIKIGGNGDFNSDTSCSIGKRRVDNKKSKGKGTTTVSVQAKALNLQDFFNKIATDKTINRNHISASTYKISYAKDNAADPDVAFPKEYLQHELINNFLISERGRIKNIHSQLTEEDSSDISVHDQLPLLSQLFELEQTCSIDEEESKISFELSKRGLKKGAALESYKAVIGDDSRRITQSSKNSVLFEKVEEKERVLTRFSFLENQKLYRAKKLSFRLKNEKELTVLDIFAQFDRDYVYLSGDCNLSMEKDLLVQYRVVISDGMVDEFPMDAYLAKNLYELMPQEAKEDIHPRAIEQIEGIQLPTGEKRGMVSTQYVDVKFEDLDYGIFIKNLKLIEAPSCGNTTEGNGDASEVEGTETTEPLEEEPEGEDGTNEEDASEEMEPPAVVSE